MAAQQWNNRDIRRAREAWHEIFLGLERAQPCDNAVQEVSEPALRLRQLPLFRKWLRKLVAQTRRWLRSRQAAAHFFPKIRFASSRVSFDPISNHKPGTRQVYTGVRVYSHCTNLPGWSGLFPSATYCLISAIVERG